ncbi:MAG: hypothetical protein OEZ39_03145 [Gammaproteobacteria bacterium]|nr:hypothetical protein [Gammaproteobacteria bacterium]MDH5650852.1 hypothetical protein [Gammaproteobacteria bacterium]
MNIPNFFKAGILFSIVAVFISGCGGSGTGQSGVSANAQGYTDNAWTTITPINGARAGMSSCSYQDNIYIFGGTDFHTTVEMLDIATNTWYTRTPLTTPRRYGSACAVIQDKIYVIGGYKDLSSTNLYLNNVEVYSPDSDSWSTASPMNLARANHSSAVVNGKIYVFGGRNQDLHISQSDVVEEYNPATDTWTIVSTMPIAHHSMAITELNDKIYLFGGYNSAGASNLVYEYTPQNNSWDMKAFMPTARSGLTASIIKGKIYVAGGSVGGMDSMKTLEIYNPVSDSWQAGNDMPTAREYHVANTYNNKIYMIAGRTTVAYDGDIASVEVYDPAKDGNQDEQ